MSVFHPEGGMPRLIRFVPSSQMPSDDTLTTYDPKYNLVIINKELYDRSEFHIQYQAICATTALVIDN